MELMLQILAFVSFLLAATYAAAFSGVLGSFAFLSFERSRQAQPGAARVDLVGHSLLSHFFPKHPYGLFHPALPHLAELQESVRRVKDTAFVSIYSRDDQLVVPGESGRLEGFGTNHPLADIGHNSLLFSKKTARLAAQELLGS